MPYLVDVPLITIHHAPLYIIAANREVGLHHKLFQIRIVSGTNASLAVDFPYSPFESGIAMRAKWSLEDPSQRPKYNHH